MKEAVYWDIKTQFLPHRKHISATEPSREYYVRFEVFTTVTVKNAVFWNVTPCSSFKNRRFGGSYRIHQSELRSVLQSLLAANVVPSSLIVTALMMEAICSFETSIPTTATRCYIPEHGILHSEFDYGTVTFHSMLFLYLLAELTFHVCQF
jgi:hypothetical protein